MINQAINVVKNLIQGEVFWLSFAFCIFLIAGYKPIKSKIFLFLDNESNKIQSSIHNTLLLKETSAKNLKNAEQMHAETIKKSKKQQTLLNQKIKELEKEVKTHEENTIRSNDEILAIYQEAEHKRIIDHLRKDTQAKLYNFTKARLQSMGDTEKAELNNNIIDKIASIPWNLQQ